MNDPFASQLLEALLRAVADAAGSRAGVRVAVLFGSQAEGRAGPSSDIDLAVALDVPLAAAERERMAAAIVMDLGRDVDLVDLRSAPSHLVSRILRSGKILAGAGTPALAELVCRMVSEREDIGPYQRRMLEARAR